MAVSPDGKRLACAAGQWTLTAANGDTLVLDMGGHGIDAAHRFGAFTVAGGTGRFQRATGYYEQIIKYRLPLSAYIRHDGHGYHPKRTIPCAAVGFRHGHE